MGTCVCVLPIDPCCFEKAGNTKLWTRLSIDLSKLVILGNMTSAGAGELISAYF